MSNDPTKDLIVEYQGPMVEVERGRYEGFSFVRSPILNELCDFADIVGQPRIEIDTRATEWLMPDGLVPGDVRHEAARGPMWPSMWTPVRKAVLEVVL